MRILRFHKLMPVSVFVTMQVCKLGAKMARLLHSDSIVALFFNFYTFRPVSMSVIISNDVFTRQIAITFGSLVDSLTVSRLWMQECRTQER